MSWVVWALIGGVGVLQLPLLVDLVLALVPGARGSVRRLTQRTVSVALIGIVAAVCIAAIAYYYIIFLPRVADTKMARLLHTTFITVVWLLTLDNYAHCCLIRPPPEDLKRRRVQGFDHYCPFTMNLVYQHNYRLFFQFLTLATTGMAYAAYVSWPPFFHCWVQPILGQPSGAVPACTEATHVSLVFVPALLLLSGVGALLACQLWLFAVNKTTADFFKDAHERGLYTAFFHRHPTKPTNKRTIRTRDSAHACVCHALTLASASSFVLLLLYCSLLGLQESQVVTL
ncbi:hypothetical protein PTSG_05230 [Salpingoeca rosetta]|uniref:Palmitoyltransferase n=1 Tax=Salpingoeca rosetta (strain ATCC 50818 / BSB-021) TaxID=946362 RepID=F2UAW0_SALR5|nr:uncharacterized protein PTSG_05230 [Salpingoeca rosetta]EGD73526.1 hypothetical protein PTSG_05230 [Salpingoeca rosetta]|eukprot:XP_004993808.1 hypothetical protein PTSG_05230 [Salpingoeca rosetta]